MLQICCMFHTKGKLYRIALGSNAPAAVNHERCKKNVGSNQETPDFQRIVIFNEFDLAALMNAG